MWLLFLCDINFQSYSNLNFLILNNLQIIWGKSWFIKKTMSRRSSMSPRRRRRRNLRKNAEKKKAAEQDELNKFLEELNQLQELKYDKEYGQTQSMGERYGYNAGLGGRFEGVEQSWQNYCQITPSAWLNKHSKLVFEHAFERGFQSGAYQLQCEADGNY